MPSCNLATRYCCSPSRRRAGRHSPAFFRCGSPMSMRSSRVPLTVARPWSLHPLRSTGPSHSLASKTPGRICGGSTSLHQGNQTPNPPGRAAPTRSSEHSTSACPASTANGTLHRARRFSMWFSVCKTIPVPHNVGPSGSICCTLRSGEVTTMRAEIAKMSAPIPMVRR